jgi:hypothetical protein
VTSDRTGFSVVTAQRLAMITTSVGGVERPAYELSYAPDDAFPVARLTTLFVSMVRGEPKLC